jgi:ABC-type transport system involved in multi-copper enzyme maturation permease subunit
MPEGVHPYPRWNGTLLRRQPFGAMVGEVVRDAFQQRWSLLILLAAVAWGASSIIEVLQFRQEGFTEHRIEWYLSMLDQLRWFAVAAAAAIGAPAILDDARSGALELYFTRGVSPTVYVLAKAVAVTLLTTAVIVVPAIVYYGAVYALFDEHPAGWDTALAGGVAYGLLWGLVLSGLALGISAATRTARASVLLLLGVFAGLEVFVARLLGGLTGDARLQVLSPFKAFDQLQTWLFAVEPEHAFPAWWGLVAVGALLVFGWALLAWRRPQVRGARS